VEALPSGASPLPSRLRAMSVDGDAGR
jgi:hypothetical protein